MKKKVKKSVEEEDDIANEEKHCEIFITIVLLVSLFLLLLIPFILNKSNLFYNPNYLRVIYAILSLIIAVILFGILKGATAKIESKLPNILGGGKLTLGGAAAGCTIFFWLMINGLSPYSNLTVQILKGNELLWEPNDLAVDLLLTSKLGSIEPKEGNPAMFSYFRSV